ncbi:nucleotidyltransferase domain-containing protein [Paenibacillus beijingensis]|uniref:Oxalate:formate antiporter n=1 Tax=Paenibacillus beijingensis TaxID=1126833 RepID=A0A0D5NJB5_9BACL|nr:nucleotidyltransferase domain-containing protein [Paenibacillus beijingensis]AJY75180.1 oxalate:formate antiporter [Paenibacillus beijingensis]
MPLNAHYDFINRAKEKFSRDGRFVALLAGGSMITNTMDEFSDLDFVAVYRPEEREAVMNERLLIAQELGGLLSAFTGDHVGEPRLIICLYGPPLLHVDMKFVMPQELEERVEDPLILWEQGRVVSDIIGRTSSSFPYPDPQWIEDRFWVWVHYGAAKLGRGELFELIDHLTFIRGTVLGPLLLIRSGQLPRGVRKLEQYAGPHLDELIETVPLPDRESCYRALKATVHLYRQLREASSELLLRKEAEAAAVAYLDSILSS